MSERAWYRSLYWRIALGFILFLGAMLATQAGLFLWLAVGSSAGDLAPEALDDLSRVVAADLGETLARTDDIDINAHLRERYGDVAAIIVVVSADGRVASSTDTPAPEPLVRMARMRLAAVGPSRFRRDRPFRGPGPPGVGMAPVVVGRRPVAMVLVARDRPWRSLLGELGPFMVLVAGLLLVSGTALAAVSIFRPAHRRLRALELATTRLGTGELDVRVPAEGGDEIAAVAGAFNRMAAELESRETELRAADRMRRQLLADVSHELMTPLTSIRGYLETLRMTDVPIDAAARERYHAILDDETHRLERLIGDLLDLSRLEDVGFSLALGDASVADLFERVMARHDRLAEERGVTLTTRVGDGADLVRGDAERLEQALQNLAANALRHTPSGGRVTLESRRVGDALVVTVRDTGEGIAPEHLPHIFDRFYKADESRQGSTGGSGLGLSIVKAIVERHGGTLTARSTEREGTVFEIRLPSPA